jgi:protein involved in sex pheromone biosynthesis
LVLTGLVELAAVGVSIALFNQASRIAIFPLVSVASSFVAEEDTLSGASSQVEENGCLEAATPPDAETETKEFLPQKSTSFFYFHD